MNKLVKIIFLSIFALIFFQSANAQTYTAEEQNCFNMVQGKVAWDKAGTSKTWVDANVRSLCSGTQNATATITCFRNKVSADGNYGQAIRDCSALTVNLNGTWTGYDSIGKVASNPGTITQNGAALTIDNGVGNQSEGSVFGDTITVLNWGLTGKLSQNGTKITWSNNTTWLKTSAWDTQAPKVTTSVKSLQGSWVMMNGSTPIDKVGTITQSGSNLVTDNAYGAINNFVLFGTQIKDKNGSIVGKVSADGQQINWTGTQVIWRKERPINEYTYVATHNATASYTYGYTLQNSQRYSVTTQLDGGVRMLEIDIVYDKPEDVHPQGLYICHCGDAPHSFSKMEINRANDKSMKSRIPLSNWSHGMPFKRFFSILQEIDKWLVANPKEIVFIMLENNGASVQQFDYEVQTAGLKTGIFKSAGSWATKSQLVSQNKRLIFLTGDGGDALAGSRYANHPNFTSWKGFITPEIYPAPDDKNNKNHYWIGDGDENRMLVLGNFKTDTTDAITARYYNEYSHLSKKRAEWQRDKITRYPTFIQFNQIHIGDAVRFVNELNPIENQVVSKMPSDPVGDWIVNASADIGATVVEGVNAVNDAFTGGEIGKNQRAIKFFNQAGYVAKMVVEYNEIDSAGKYVWKSQQTENLTAGITRHLIIPKNVGGLIQVKIIGSGTVKNNLYHTTVVAEGFTGTLCYKAWGTFLDPQGGGC